VGRHAGKQAGRQAKQQQKAASQHKKVTFLIEIFQNHSFLFFGKKKQKEERFYFSPLCFGILKQK
jgi:hypothetical protein